MTSYLGNTILKLPYYALARNIIAIWLSIRGIGKLHLLAAYLAGKLSVCLGRYHFHRIPRFRLYLERNSPLGVLRQIIQYEFCLPLEWIVPIYSAMITIHKVSSLGGTHSCHTEHYRY